MLSYLILYFYRTPLGLFIAMAFLNFGQGIMTLYYKMQIVQNTVIERIGLMMGFYSATVYGSSLVGPFVPSWINKISIGETASITGSFVTVFIILAIATVAYIPLLLKQSK